MQQIPWTHGSPVNNHFLQEHSLFPRLTENCSLDGEMCQTSKKSSPQRLFHTYNMTKVDHALVTNWFKPEIKKGPK